MSNPDSVAAVREQAYELSLQRVRDLPERERPREKFKRDGVQSLSNRELLALLIRAGTRGANALDIAGQMLSTYGSLTDMAKVSTDELRRFHGMGEVKAQIIGTALELARRLADEAMPERPSVRTPEDAARLMRDPARYADEESFWVLALDTKYRLHRPPLTISRGILDASLVHPREVFREAIRSSCAAIVLVHNHPSGDPTPSAEDIRITRQLVETGKVVDIEVLDHVVLGRRSDSRDKDYLSLRESGLVDFTR